MTVAPRPPGPFRWRCPRCQPCLRAHFATLRTAGWLCLPQGNGGRGRPRKRARCTLKQHLVGRKFRGTVEGGRERGPCWEIRDLTGGVFAAAACNTMRSVCFVQRTGGGRGCGDLILSLPNTPTLDTFNSGTAWPHHSAWEGGEEGGRSTGRRRGSPAQPGWL